MEEKKDIEQLVRENIRALVPYSSARDDYSGSASVFLDANENPHNPPLNRYPDPGQKELKRRISEIRGLEPKNIFTGNGSDEGIDLLFRVFCEPGVNNAITVDPTYGMYGVCARINAVERRSVLLETDFSLNAQRVVDTVDGNTRLIFLCSPNNPTANALDREEMVRIIDLVDCLVVVDEAYIDFSSGSSLLSLVPEKENLVVLQTLSKAWGLAGIRLGMLFAHEKVIGYLSRVKYPYNINTLSMQEALRNLSGMEQAGRWVSQILKERSLLADRLSRLPFVEKVFPSDANFLLVKMEQPGAVYTYLMNMGIIVRDRSSAPLCGGCLRITVGTESENGALCEALERYDPSADTDGNGY